MIVGGSYVRPSASRRSSRRVVHSSIGPTIDVASRLNHPNSRPISRRSFPICAAVRKSDRDLKAAIDRAFAELAESGKLAEVYARWHIPFVAPPKDATDKVIR